MHTDSKPFKCASKSFIKFKEGFKSQQALDRHMDIHKGNLIKCDVEGCQKSFNYMALFEGSQEYSTQPAVWVQTCIRWLHIQMQV